MDEKLTLDVGLANAIRSAASRSGWTNTDLKRLSNADVMRYLLQILRYNAVENLIDGDADPFIPEDCSVMEHFKGGQFHWNPDNVKLCVSDVQHGGCVGANEFREFLNNETVLNANVLDFLLANTKLIPNEWKSKNVLFWGTVYYDSRGNRFIRCLEWDDGQWGWFRKKFDQDFYFNDQAACCK